VPELIRRQAALGRTMARFRRKPFRLGRNDCVQLARFHLKAMGHRKLPASGRYSTPAGARRALRSTGHETLEALLDSLLPRIAPAAMLPGDVALLAAEPGAPAADVGAIAISLGGKLMGWHPDKEELAVLDVSAIAAAWRA